MPRVTTTVTVELELTVSGDFTPYRAPKLQSADDPTGDPGEDAYVEDASISVDAVTIDGMGLEEIDYDKLLDHPSIAQDVGEALLDEGQR